MKEPYEKGVASHSAPSFAVGVARRPLKRKQGNRWAGYRASKNSNRDADVFVNAEGNMTKDVSASSRSVPRSRNQRWQMQQGRFRAAGMMIHHSRRLIQFLSCYLDYRTGGSLLDSRPGSILKSAEGLGRVYSLAFGDHGTLWATMSPLNVPPGSPGWIVKMERGSGKILGYVPVTDTSALHCLEVVNGNEPVCTVDAGAGQIDSRKYAKKDRPQLKAKPLPRRR